MTDENEGNPNKGSKEDMEQLQAAKKVSISAENAKKVSTSLDQGDVVEESAGE